MKMTVKVHKKPVSFRFITNGRDAFTSGTCVWLQPILALLITDIRSIAADRARVYRNFTGIPVNMFWCAHCVCNVPYRT